VTSWISQVVGRLVIALCAMASWVAITDSLERLVVTATTFAVVVARGGLSRSSYDHVAARCLGLALPLVPWVGAQVLLVPVLAFFGLRPAQSDVLADSKGEGASGAWIALFLGFIVGTVLGELARAIGLIGAAPVGGLADVRIDGVMRATDLVRAALEVQLPTWTMAVRVLCVVLVISFFSYSSETIHAFVKWLKRGCVVLALYVVGQYLAARYSGSLASSGVLWRLPNQTPLWDSLGRPSGLVTDPNALGVVLALSLWIAFLVPAPKRPGWLWSALLVVAGIVSGSRTFLISIALLLPLIAWCEQRRKLLWGALSAAALAIVCTTLLDRYSGFVGQLVASEGLPMGVRRGVAALSLLRLEETFMSRGVFIDLARAIGAGHRLFGIGAGRFIDYVPLVGAELNLVRGWKDNSNNFYIGILTELGIVGASLFMVAILGRRVRVTEPPVHSMSDTARGAKRTCAVWCLVMLGILGCTGPHTDFTEVLLLFAFLAAVTTEVRPVIGKISLMLPFRAAVCAAVLLGGIASGHHEQGVYGWGNTTTGATRWLSHSASVLARCERNPEGSSRAALLLRPQYIPQSEPLRVVLRVAGQEPQEFSFQSSDAREVTVPCSLAKSDLASEEVFVHIVTSPAWSPYRAWPRVSGDRRILGVQQVFRVD
jgi:hypothetical protein